MTRRLRTLPAGVYLDRKSGRYIAKLRLGGVMSKAVTFDTVSEAVEHLDALRAAFAESTAPERSKGMTLGEWIDTWIPRRRSSGRYRDVDGDARLLARYVGADLRETPLRELRARDMRSWLYDLAHRTAKSGGGRGADRARPLSRQTVANALNLLRSCLAEAVDAGKMSSNPLVGLRPPRVSATTTEHTGYLSADQVRALLTHPGIPEANRIVYTVAIYTGLRAGEMWGLRWEDVTLDGPRPELVVRHSYDGPTKGGRVRRVPLLAPARDALLRLRDSMPARPIAGLVWPSPRRDAEGRERCHLRGYDADWRRYASLAGVAVPLKQARHTCGSHLVIGTWGPPMPLEAVQHWLGHASVTTTERFYARYSPAALHAHRAAIDSSAGSSAAKAGRKTKKPKS